MTQSDLNKAYLDAVAYLDIERALALLDAGADPNALDTMGEGALASLCERWYPPPPQGSGIATDAEGNARPTEAQITDMMRRLIARGADVNAHGPDGYGAQGCSTLINAVLSAQADVVEFLLEHGADPNFNPWPDESPHVVSKALDYALCDANLAETDEEREALERIIALLEAHGAILEVEEGEEASAADERTQENLQKQ